MQLLCSPATAPNTFIYALSLSDFVAQIFCFVFTTRMVCKSIVTVKKEAKYCQLIKVTKHALNFSVLPPCATEAISFLHLRLNISNRIFHPINISVLGWSIK